jgi:nitroreductase
MEPADKEVLSDIGQFYEGIPSLFPGIQTEIGITTNVDGRNTPFALFSVKAPYYLTIYSEKKDKYEMNAGYICEQLSLYMMTLGLGSCFLGGTSVPKNARLRGTKEFVIMMAFGKPKEPLTRRPGEAKREELKDLCVYKEQPAKWVNEVLEAARLAPSALNSQPWRFVIMGNRIHIFSKKPDITHSGRWDEFDFGILFAHIMVAADELWLDLDLIRLENISQKNFKSSQYVLSALLKNE